MADKFQNKYRIASARLQTWNYGWDAAYFITICTYKRQHYFGHIENGKMNLSGVGILADVFWHEIKNHAYNVELGEFVVMPNHIHGILILNNETNNDETIIDDTATNVETRHALSLQMPPQPPETTIGQQRFQNQGKNTISSIVGSYKSAVTRHARRLGFDCAWQTRFYDHIIRDSKAYNKISTYIINNPQSWNEDKFFN